MVTHHHLGHVDLNLALAMIIGSVPGSLIGSTVAIKLKDSWLRRAFGVVMLVVAAILAGKEMDAD
jgi:Sulfite exporter TauE/SafE.